MNDKDATEKLLAALGHPARREVLGRMVQEGKPLSPAELADQLGMQLSNVSYHARVLVQCGMLDLVGARPTKGPIQHFYKPSDLVEHPKVKEALGLDDADGT
jgi:DNA-binding transcriptional ArsR family regulator